MEKSFIHSSFFVNRSYSGNSINRYVSKASMYFVLLSTFKYSCIWTNDYVNYIDKDFPVVYTDCHLLMSLMLCSLSTSEGATKKVATTERISPYLF